MKVGDTWESIDAMKKIMLERNETEKGKKANLNLRNLSIRGDREKIKKTKRR